MATEGRRRLVLGALLVLLAVALYRVWTGPAGTTSGAPALPSNTRAREAVPGAGAEPPDAAPDVRLQALDGERPRPGDSERNLFRFGQQPLPPSTNPIRPTVARPAVPSEPAGPPPLAPIPLRFIGIVEAPTQSKRIAALVDSTGHAYQGGEGDIVAGQYRVLRIGVESIEMSYLDGRGRQTIRLSGS
jgi:hypothetical protein